MVVANERDGIGMAWGAKPSHQFRWLILKRILRSNFGHLLVSTFLAPTRRWLCPTNGFQKSDDDGKRQEREKSSGHKKWRWRENRVSSQRMPIRRHRTIKHLVGWEIIASTLRRPTLSHMVDATAMAIMGGAHNDWVFFLVSYFPLPIWRKQQICFSENKGGQFMGGRWWW